MRTIKSRIGGLVLGAVAFPAFACDLPRLPIIPAKDQIGDQAPTVSAATGAAASSRLRPHRAASK